MYYTSKCGPGSSCEADWQVTWLWRFSNRYYTNILQLHCALHTNKQCSMKSTRAVMLFLTLLLAFNTPPSAVHYNPLNFYWNVGEENRNWPWRLLVFFLLCTLVLCDRLSVAHDVYTLAVYPKPNCSRTRPCFCRVFLRACAQQSGRTDAAFKCYRNCIRFVINWPKGSFFRSLLPVWALWK